MHANPKLLLRATTVVETATGVGLLIVPGVVLALLLGVQQAQAETLLAGRVAGVALLSFGIAIWLTCSDTSQPVQRGLITGITVYTVGASVLLLYAGAVLRLAGILLWPAVLFHAALAVWCFMCLGSPRLSKRPP